MKHPSDVQHQERWEMLAIALAEVLRRVLDVPKPGETAEESIEEAISGQAQEVPS